MFRRNTDDRERDLFDDILVQFPEVKRHKALASREYAFYEEVFRHIDETVFEPLFAGNAGRPNAPLNCMAAALILREANGWTYDELFTAMDFNLLTRLALGLTTLTGTPFCAATLFNFQKRLVEYEQEHGVNLFERLFEVLTADQLARFEVSAGIQRSDSFRAMSNIANYGRVRLLIEVLLRLYRVLEDADRGRLNGVLEPYTSQSSDNYVYRVEAKHLPRELKRLAELYTEVATVLGDRYAEQPAYQAFRRVMAEQFELTGDGSVRVRDRKEIGTDSLQSPDDPEATYNAKNGTPQKGYKVNVTETAAGSNAVNLVTDVAVDANNVSDGEMLAGRMDTIKQKTPELAEMHTDGGYGGSKLDPAMAGHRVLHVETGTKMGRARVNMVYEQTEAGYRVSCPSQTVAAERTPKHWKAVFSADVCGRCPHSEVCPAKQHKAQRTFYFKESWAKSFIRSRNVEKIPEDRRTLRANVEATVKQFCGCFNHKGKLRIRGLARVRLQMLAAAMAINFGRIFRWQAAAKPAETGETPPPTAASSPVSAMPCPFIRFFRRFAAKVLGLACPRQSSSASFGPLLPHVVPVTTGGPFPRPPF